MANLTPWLSTLRCIVPVASSGQILSQYVLVLASMQTPCSHLLRVTHECIVCSLRSSFLNVGMQLICLKDLESEAPVLNSEFCIRGLEGRLTFFFGHLLAEIFGAISLCSFWKGRLKENHLSAVTGRGVDQKYYWPKSNQTFGVYSYLRELSIQSMHCRLMVDMLFSFFSVLMAPNFPLHGGRPSGTLTWNMAHENNWCTY